MAMDNQIKGKNGRYLPMMAVIQDPDGPVRSIRESRISIVSSHSTATGGNALKVPDFRILIESSKLRAILSWIIAKTSL
jgi:hypothetical protein